MRRLLLLVLLAPVLVPASASAEGYNVQFGMPRGGVIVSDFQDCPGETCEPVPISIALDRGNVGIVETAGPALEPHITTSPQLGDVVRIYRDGVERAVAWYDPTPTVEDASCAVVGGTTLTGTFRRGEPGMRTVSSPGYGLVVDSYTYVRVALWDARAGSLEGTLSVDGTRWTAQFPSPITTDQSLLVMNTYGIASPVGGAMITTTRGVPYCPPPPLPPGPPITPPPPCTTYALRGSPFVATAVRRAVATLSLKRLRRGTATLADLPVCAGGRISATVTTTGRRRVVVAEGKQTPTPERATVRLGATRHAKRLAGRRKVRVKVAIRYADAAGDVETWTRRVTLR